MHRCIELARHAAGHVAPNPMVGAVLVHDDVIIGEGYHQVYGGPHAEVNCLASVPSSKDKLVPHSTLYVSLEPCAHFGKTPPCADLIIKKKIPRVVIGCRDPFYEVNGKGIEKLNAAGVQVVTGILENECRMLNSRFFTFHEKHRPYIILKWAQTADKKIGNPGNNRLLITNNLTNRLVHKWRSEEAGIMVGTNTALLDDPQLTNRLWSGNQPVRIVIDKELRLLSTLKIFDGKTRTIVFNLLKHEEQGSILFYQVTVDVSLVHQITNALYHLKIMSVMIEGGSQLIQSFIDDGIWDEARVITNPNLTADKGVPAPLFTNEQLNFSEEIEEDCIRYYWRKGSSF